MKLYQLQHPNGTTFKEAFKTSSVANIKDYVRDNIYDYSDYINEIHSCTITLSHDRKSIIIIGDEDYIGLEIKEVEIIEL